jgi:hypothetical protein
MDSSSSDTTARSEYERNLRRQMRDISQSDMSHEEKGRAMQRLMSGQWLRSSLTDSANNIETNSDSQHEPVTTTTTTETGDSVVNYKLSAEDLKPSYRVHAHHHHHHHHHHNNRRTTAALVTDMICMHGNTANNQLNRTKRITYLVASTMSEAARNLQNVARNSFHAECVMTSQQATLLIGMPCNQSTNAQVSPALSIEYKDVSNTASTVQRFSCSHGTVLGTQLRHQVHAVYVLSYLPNHRSRMRQPRVRQSTWRVLLQRVQVPRQHSWQTHLPLRSLWFVSCRPRSWCGLFSLRYMRPVSQHVTMYVSLSLSLVLSFCVIQ